MDISKNNIQPDRSILARNRAAVRAFRTRLGEHSQEIASETRDDTVDRVDVSRRGEVLSSVQERLENVAKEADRADIAKLKRAYQSGELNSPARIAQAAARLLGQEA